MAKNPPKDGRRKGAVKSRSQVKTLKQNVMLNVILKLVDLWI